MQKTLFTGLILLSLAAVIWTGCNPNSAPTPDEGVGGQTGAPDPDSPVSSDDSPQEPAPAGEGEIIVSNAMVSGFDILFLESWPLQVNLVIRGDMPNACAMPEVQVEPRAEDTFNVHVQAVTPADQVCAQVLTPFETTAALNVYGLRAGTYTVNVNDQTQTFTFEQDNVPATDENY